MRAAALLAAIVLVLAACSDDAALDAPADGDGGDDAATDQELSGDLLVFAAASLTDAFDELGTQMEEAHPDLTVTFNYASSSTLATQLVEGAPADVFASANLTQMDVAADDDLVDDPGVFITNVLEIVVEAGNPLGIETLEDLARDDVVLVLAAPEVPAGDFAAQMLEAEGIQTSPSSLEVDVRATLARVESGEADVAIVYRSDVVTAADSVEGVEIPEERNVIADYPIAQLTDAPNADAAAAFIELVTGPEGIAVLEAAGFTAP